MKLVSIATLCAALASSSAGAERYECDLLIDGNPSGQPCTMDSSNEKQWRCSFRYTKNVLFECIAGQIIGTEFVACGWGEAVFVQRPPRDGTVSELRASLQAGADGLALLIDAPDRSEAPEFSIGAGSETVFGPGNSAVVECKHTMP